VSTEAQAPVAESKPGAAAEPGPADGSVASAAAARPRSRRWLIVGLVVLGYLVHVAWRVWLARSVNTPVAHADEDRYLLSARVLAGGEGGLGNDTAAFRRMGYPLLLSPIYQFTSDPFKVYHAAQIFGAFFNALTFPLAYVFARRVLHHRRRLGLGLAFVAAALPAVVYYGEFTLTDVLFPPIGLAWLLLLHGWWTGRTPLNRSLAAAGAGAVVGYAYVVHVRGLIMLGVHVLALLAATYVKRSRWKTALASLVVALLVTRIDWLAQNIVGDRLIRGGKEPQTFVLGRLTDPQGWVHILVDAIGQIWYAGVATWGLGAIGFLVVYARARGDQLDDERGRGVDDGQRFVLTTALAALVAIAITSAAALPNDGRISNHVYFRYIAFLMPVFVMVGAGTLFGASRTTAMWLVRRAAVLIVATGVVVLTQFNEWVPQWFHPFDTPETSFLSKNWSHLAVSKASLSALVLLAVLALLMSRPGRPSARTPRVMAAGLAAVLLVNVVAMEVTNFKSVRPMARAEYQDAPRLVRDIGVGRGDVVATSSRVSLGGRLNHQREVYWSSVIQFDHLNSSPPADATVVIGPWHSRNDDDWDGTGLGWTRVGDDTKNEWAVWLRSDDPRIAAALRASGDG
jgi:hypothetical protein